MPPSPSASDRPAPPWLGDAGVCRGGRDGLLDLPWPRRGPVSALASPVGNPQVVYAGVFGGVFKSVDGGATWSSTGHGIDVPATVCSLTIDPLHPSTLYAGTCLGFSGLQRVRSGLFKSVDGGSTWKLTGLVASDVPIVAINPRFPQTLFAGTPRGFYQSSNGGQTWRLISQGVLRASLPTALAIDPTSPRRMFGQFIQLSSFKMGLFRSLDGGASWQSVQSDLPDIMTLAIDPRSPKTLYASPPPTPALGLGVSTGAPTRAVTSIANIPERRSCVAPTPAPPGPPSRTASPVSTI
jgi:hypothetical protein